jgi:hypothetical protein
VATQIYTDENKQFTFDFSKAIWASDKLNDKYKYAKVDSSLSDVDFIAETDQEIIFVEFKNSNVPNAANPEAFGEKLATDKHYVKIASKYFGALLYVVSCEKRKTYRYVYILESAYAGSTERGLIRSKIQPKLPFVLQKDPDVKISLIDDFEVLSIDEWNNNSLYGQFPITPL